VFIFIGALSHLIIAYSEMGDLVAAQRIFSYYLIVRKDLQHAMQILQSLEAGKALRIAHQPNTEPIYAVPPIPKRVFATMLSCYGMRMISPVEIFSKIVLSEPNVRTHYEYLVSQFRKKRDQKLDDFQGRIAKAITMGDKRQNNVFQNIAGEKRKVDLSWMPGDAVAPDLTGATPYCVDVWDHVGMEGPFKSLYEGYMKGYQKAIRHLSSNTAAQPSYPIAGTKQSDSEDAKGNSLTPKDAKNNTEDENSEGAHKKSRINLLLHELYDPRSDRLPLRAEKYLSYQDHPTYESSQLLMQMEDYILEMQKAEANALDAYMRGRGLRTNMKMKNNTIVTSSDHK
jgi:hypothetical protein